MYVYSTLSKRKEHVFSIYCKKKVITYPNISTSIITVSISYTTHIHRVMSYGSKIPKLTGNAEILWPCVAALRNKRTDLLADLTDNISTSVVSDWICEYLNSPVMGYLINYQSNTVNFKATRALLTIKLS